MHFLIILKNDKNSKPSFFSKFNYLFCKIISNIAYLVWNVVWICLENNWYNVYYLYHYFHYKPNFRLWGKKRGCAWEAWLRMLQKEKKILYNLLIFIMLKDFSQKEMQTCLLENARKYFGMKLRS